MTFTERKQARIAASPKTFAFEVVAGFPFSGEVMGRFSSRKAAEEFAFSQCSTFVGDSMALRALSAKCGRTRPISDGQKFSVFRVEV